jgi:heat shock protein HtpX
MTGVPCPRCGIHNRPSAPICALCQAVFGEAAAAGREAQARTPARGRRDFDTEQQANIRSSWILMILVVGLLALIGWLAGMAWTGHPGGWMVGLAAGAMASLFAVFGGDRAVLMASGAVAADREKFPQLHNIVEELCLASGLPKPRLYVIESPALNAFATGRDPDHASVAVTRGLLGALNRGELQGVLAHEMSHVRNFDIRFALVVGALVGSVALLSDAILRGSRGVQGRSRRGGPIVIVALLAAILAPFAAALVRMAISRRRELLADATAVELTRDPVGLASALRRIGGDREPLAAANRATQHMYIANPFRDFGPDASALLSTHPPIETRIRILEAMS